ncbi:tetraspanin-7 [Patella vulgata]|uniref:tetraspanin-7 n=1 Tax=Patella vulgata TaxID=6465 RepID=UPI00218052C2|nr:tetraspanin-7 [Patella vulgata]
MTQGRVQSTMHTAPLVTCMKTLLMVFNFIFWVTGIVLLAVGIKTKIDWYKYLELSSVYHPETPYVLIGVGAVIVLIGSLGCCCTVKGHSFLLFMYCGFLALIFIVELSAGIALLIYRTKLEEGFREGLNNAINIYGDKGKEEYTNSFDDMQKTLHCCGINSYTDWYNTKWEKTQSVPNSVPKSCCKVVDDNCKHTNLPANATNLDIDTQGCHKLVVDFINGNLGPIGGVALGISFFQILGAILACFLAKSINKAKYEQVA